MCASLRSRRALIGCKTGVETLAKKCRVGQADNRLHVNALRTGGVGRDGCQRENGARAHRNVLSMGTMLAFQDGTRILVGLHWQYDALNRSDIAAVVSMVLVVYVGPFGPPYRGCGVGTAESMIAAWRPAVAGWSAVRGRRRCRCKPSRPKATSPLTHLRQGPPPYPAPIP